MSDDWEPSWARGKQPRGKPKGFTTDLGQHWEAEKRDREIAREGYAVVLATEPVWKADDPRWKIPESSYRFRAYSMKYGGPCVYCGEQIAPGAFELYCPVIRSIAHRACEAGRSGPQAVENKRF